MAIITLNYGYDRAVMPFYILKAFKNRNLVFKNFSPFLKAWHSVRVQFNYFKANFIRLV